MSSADSDDSSVSRRNFLAAGAASATAAATASAAEPSGTTAQPTYATSPDAPAGPHLVVSRIERPLPMPNSITEAVLAKHDATDTSSAAATA